MSTDSVVVFYGAELPLSNAEISSCETRQHPVIKAAREAQLDHYWADFIPDDEHGPQLLVGRRFGCFGPEDSYEAHIERRTITLAIDTVDTFLAHIGLPTPGKLIIRFRQDL